MKPLLKLIKIDELYSLLPHILPDDLKFLITCFADEYIFDIKNKSNLFQITNLKSINIKSEPKIIEGYHRAYITSRYGTHNYLKKITIQLHSKNWGNRAVGITKNNNRHIGWISCDDNEEWCTDSKFSDDHLFSFSHSCMDIKNVGRVELESTLTQMDCEKEKLSLSINKSSNEVIIQSGKLNYIVKVDGLDAKNIFLCVVCHRENDCRIDLL